MTTTTAISPHWSLFADSERTLLSRHLNAMAMAKPLGRAAGAERAAAEDAPSLAPIVPIALLTLFMVWTTISPL